MAIYKNAQPERESLTLKKLQSSNMNIWYAYVLRQKRHVRITRYINDVWSNKTSYATV